MTAQEIYIRIQNDLNSVGANRNRRYLPEQIELAVNTEQIEYILNAFPEEPGIHFKPEQRYLDAVQGLIDIKEVALHPAGLGFLLPIETIRVLSVDILKSIRLNWLGKDGMKCIDVSGPQPSARRAINGMQGTIQKTAFYKDNDHEVVFSLRDHQVRFHSGSSISPRMIAIEYIKTPKKFSISGDQTLELTPAFHEEICDRVVQRLRERIGDPKFKTGLTERNNTL